MNPNQKIARWISKTGVTQTELARRSGIAQNKISDIVKGKAKATAHQSVPLAKAMGVSLDWLFNDDLDWPPFGPDDRGRVLSPAEVRLLQLAAILCEDDPEPSELRSATHRLMGMGAIPSLRAEGAVPLPLLPHSAPTLGDGKNKTNGGNAPRRGGASA